MADQPVAVLQPFHVLGIDKVDHLVVVAQTGAGGDPVSSTMQKHHSGSYFANQAGSVQVQVAVLAPRLSRFPRPVDKVDAEVRCIALHGNDLEIRVAGRDDDMAEIVVQAVDQCRRI